LLDSNVLVAAFTTRGLCADVVRVVLADHDLVLGDVNVREVRRVLTQRMKVSPAVVDRIEDLLRAQTVVGKARKRPAFDVRDPDDAWVLGAALAGQVEVLVTGDRDLLEMAEPPLPILSPRDFWELARKQASDER
jgi:putative PIN family toxin of toxin-antitoxin system